MSLFPRFVSQEIRPLLRLFEDPIYYSPSTHHQNSRRAFQPNFDVQETKDAYELSGEVPGVSDKKNLDIHFVDAQTLVVKGKVERYRSNGSPSTENTHVEAESATTTTTTTEAAQKPPKPTVEDEANASNSSNEKTSALAKPAPQEVKKADTHGRRVWVSERLSGEFQRSFSFPAIIDQDAVKASLKDGILSIVVPKRELKGARKIDVE